MNFPEKVDSAYTKIKESANQLTYLTVPFSGNIEKFALKPEPMSPTTNMSPGT
jgi:hypothetical protein